MPKPVAPPEPPAPVRKPRKAAAPRTPKAAKAAAPVTTRTSAAPRRWSAPADFVPHIVAMLDEADGGLRTDDALARLEERVADELRPGDREKSPQGEQRWRTAARKARRELVTSGILSDAQPGVWQLRS
ncbi:hypothetical protein [Nocardioides sp. JQ2195]|uniref:hypothetical protein n=1 Tax=Nocardioides sp. JQ2195 TaxID=2592334 RepID=UPI001F0ED7AC|nr:hypothetical protein [Nocardioides sp. JQ2195]